MLVLVEMPRTAVGQNIAFASLFVWPVSSIYCGIWLARRVGQTPLTTSLWALGFSIGIAVLNFFILAAGCSKNFSL